MKLRHFIMLLVTLVAAVFIERWYTIVYMGNQLDNVTPVTWFIMASIPVAIVLGVVSINQGLKYILPVVLIGMIGSSCGRRAHANRQTLHTTDCGANWNKIEPGEVVPSCHMACQCDYTVTIPDYPMQGESNFKIMFSGKVLAAMDVAYDYSIVDGLGFIKEAKYIGKMDSSADDESNNSSAYETAENVVIDKRIREAMSELANNEDVVDFDPSSLEDKVLTRVNEMLKPKGVVINFIAITPQFDEQTRTAIDAATAHKIYKSKGLDSLGEIIMAAKAGATHIVIEQGK